VTLLGGSGWRAEKIKARFMRTSRKSRQGAVQRRELELLEVECAWAWP
jgi:hypothetical protein